MAVEVVFQRFARRSVADSAANEEDRPRPDLGLSVTVTAPLRIAITDNG